MKMILHSLLFSFLISCGMSFQDEQSIAFDHYVVMAANDNNVTEVDYLFTHFEKRSGKGVVLKQGKDKIPAEESKVQFINVAVDKNLDADYEIIKNENKLTLKANSKKTLYWLYYQYFQALSENNPIIKADDLPPAVVNFANSKKVKFAFTYREPHLKANLETDYDVIVNTNNVEKDWGLWGHQLFKVVNKNQKDEYYSIVEGKLNKNQLCFAKPAMYNFLVNYVIDNFGEQEKSHQKFVIAPADNNLVCTCTACAKLGNSEGNSSFSVIALVNKLASRFPNHEFFTIDYLSVKTPPLKLMPKNTGIIISSIDLPRKVNMDSNNVFVKAFASKVESWNKVCNSVYVWDYISNFDDYLTPFATLSVCKTNFDFYKNLNVNGIFANGAGYDYSTFNEVHTYVLAALMQDPTLNVDQLVNRFCKFYYGSSGDLVANYILGLEKEMQTKKYSLDLYNGISKSTKTYLNKNDFFDFYNEIGGLKSGQSDDINLKFRQLNTGLLYSAIQINLFSGFDDSFGFAKRKDNKILINDDFRNYFYAFERQFKADNVLVTRESNGMVLNYLKDVKKVILEAKLEPNLLSKNVFKVTSELDEDYSDEGVLIDNTPGLPFDYHSGWVLVSASDLNAKIQGLNDSGLFHIKLNFLLNERLKLRAPEKVQVLVNNVIVKTIIPTVKVSESAEGLSLETSVNLNLTDIVSVRVIRDKTYNKFACDEIYFYK